MIKLTIFDTETIVQVGMPIKIQNIRTERMITAYVGLIRGSNIAVFDDDAIYVFSTYNLTDDTELYQLAHNAKLSHH